MRNFADSYDKNKFTDENNPITDDYGTTRTIHQLQNLKRQW